MYLNVRMTPRQFNALDRIATLKDKTVSELVRDLVDSVDVASSSLAHQESHQQLTGKLILA